MGKFDSRVDEGIFVGYSHKIKACICYNQRWKQIVESINFTFDEEYVVKDNNEIISKGLEVEYMEDEEESLEQDQ